MTLALKRNDRGFWFGQCPETRLRVVVAGDDETPDAQLVASVEATLARWSEVSACIERYVRALAPDRLVELDPPGRGAFGASDCGFHDGLTFQTLRATERDAPERVRVSFFTGLPDGYVTFEIALERHEPRSLLAYCS